MKVEGNSGITPLTNVSTSQAPARAQPPVSAPDQDNVSISGKSSQLQALEASIKDAPEFDTAKIEAIRQAISDGNFSISSGRVAEKMMATARDLIVPPKV